MKATIASQIARAALGLAATKPWPSLTLEKIISQAKVPSKQAKREFANRDAILPEIVRLIDKETEQRCRKIDHSASTHDRLFEAMMARFDVLQTHRRGILSIMDTVFDHPSMAAMIFPSLLTSMQHLLRLAHVEKKGVRGFLQQIGLFSVYQTGLWRWKNDSTRDLSLTMSVLDRSLRFGGKISHLIEKTK